MAVKTSLNPTGRGYVPTSTFVWNQKSRLPGQTPATSMQDSYQQYLTQMQKAQAWQQQQSADLQAKGQSYLDQLSPKIDSYMTAMQGNYDAGLNTLKNSTGDGSYLKNVFSKTMAMYQNPGWSAETIRNMKGAASAQGAAQGAAGVRQLERSMSGRGMSGPAADYLKAIVKNRYGAQTARALTGIDTNAATYAADSKKQYLGMAESAAAQLAQMSQNRTNNLAQYQRDYNPLSWLQQAQSILSPMQTIGYNVGNGSAW